MIFTTLFIGLALLGSIFVESIVSILGLFTALMGVVFSFGIPIYFMVYYPKIKENNLNKDVVDEGNSTLDPVVVGFLALASR